MHPQKLNRYGTIFLRTNRTKGEASLYTKIRRNGFQLYVCTGINVDIQEWNKSQKSMSALKRYEATPEGAKVHNLQVEVMNAIDVLYSDNCILTDEEIDAMYAMKLSGMEEKVRDVFLLGYFSCQRYSDYSDLRKKKKNVLSKF